MGVWLRGLGEQSLSHPEREAIMASVDHLVLDPIDVVAANANVHVT
jgi:hypothetical protein